MQEDEEKKSTFEFKEDGICSMQRGDRSREGTYTIEDQEGKQTLIINMGEREEVHLTEEQRKELQKLAAEMEVEAIKMRADYEQNPQPEMEGMVVSVHQDSVLLDDESVKLNADVAVEVKPKEKDNE